MENNRPPLGVRPHEIEEQPAKPHREPMSAVDRLAVRALALLGDKAIAATAVREAMEKALHRL